MEIEIKPVTPEIRFAPVPAQVIGEMVELIIDNVSALSPGDGAPEAVQPVASAAKSFLPNNIWWIIPITLLAGAGIGIAIYKHEQKRKAKK